MPLRRRRFARKRMNRRRRPIRRYARKRPASNIYYYKQMVNLGTLTASVSGAGVPTPILAGYSFKLNDLPQATTFANLYDQYKISKVVISLRPRPGIAVTSVANGNVGVQGYSPLLTVLDFDDATPPVNEGEMLSYQNCRMTKYDRNHTRVIYPKWLDTTYETALGNGYHPTNGFLDCNDNQVPHYGLKVYMSAPVAPVGSSTGISYDVYATYSVAFKNVR